MPAEVNEILYWQFRVGESKALPVPAPIIPTPAPAPSHALAPPDPNHGVATPPPDALASHDASHGAGLSPTVIGVVAVAASFLAVISGAVLFYCCWRKHISRQADGSGGTKRFRVKLTALHAYVSARKFSYDELRRATNDFAHTNMLGRGGFGMVFRGQLKDGTSVAVKRMSEQSRQGEKEFLAEVTIIGRLHHKNLVPLLGWCQNPKGELLLVYEFMPNGSLDHHVLPQQSFASTSSATNSTSSSNLPISSPEQGSVLSWDARFHILQGVASGLLHLHEDWQEGGVNLKHAVVHRDIKSSNVMLDADWNGRLGDFGLARLVEKNRSAETASAIVGTRGYLAPEYALTRKINVKADVYSFGVLVLEVVTGRPPVDWRQPFQKRVLVDWIRSLHLANERLEGAADPALRGAFKTQQMVLLLQLGLMCTADDPDDRPSMRQVVQSLASSSRPLLFPSSNVPFSNPSLGGRWSSSVQQ